MNDRIVRQALLLAAVLAGAACDGTGPVAGEVEVALTGPAPARAASFLVIGPQTGVAAVGANVRIFSAPRGGDTLMVVAVAAPGHLLSEGNVIAVSVPDVVAARNYRITPLQVAGANYALQNSAAYLLTVQQP